MKSLWLFGHYTFSYKSLSLFPSRILAYATAFAAHYIFFILRFTLVELFKQKKKKKNKQTKQKKKKKKKKTKQKKKKTKTKTKQKQKGEDI